MLLPGREGAAVDRRLGGRRRELHSGDAGLIALVLLFHTCWSKCSFFFHSKVHKEREGGCGEIGLVT